MKRSKPAILLDIDGPLNPYGMSNRIGKHAGYRKWSILDYKVWLKREHGPMLLELAAQTNSELVWATTWEHDANWYIGPKIGLPKLPVIEFNRGKWKFENVLDYAAGRKIVWFDDDFDYFYHDRDIFLGNRKDTPTRLQLISPKVGITKDDIETAKAWLAHEDANDIYGDDE